jgi:hypothetical protein
VDVAEYKKVSYLGALEGEDRHIVLAELAFAEKLISTM